MKVVGFNGSPRKKSNTGILIQQVFGELEKEGIETELVPLSGKKIRGCVACFKCFENRDRRCSVKNDDLAELGDTPIEDIQQEDENGTITYEVDAEVNGNEVEITIAEDVTILRREEEIDPASLPAAVQTTVTEQIGDAELRRVTKVTENGEVEYEIRATSDEDDRIRLTIAEDGTLVENDPGGRPPLSG